ncbi:hypothetical protein ACRXID_01705 [Ligilactobacillus animalis]|nr:hypothetical protein [Ligilactobacillus animalis]
MKMQLSKVSPQKIISYWAFATLFSFVIPIIFTVLNVDEITKTGVILFGINVVYAIAIGFYAGKHADKFWLVLFFPVIYLIGCDFFFDSHAIYCTVVYLMLTCFAYGAVRK